MDVSAASGHCDPSIWLVGVNCGKFIGRLKEACVQAQSQVLICNVVANAKAMPQEMLKSAMRKLRPAYLSETVRQSLPIRFASHMLGMSVATVESVWTFMRNSSWQPASQLLVQHAF
jgi:hypothetical protein